MKVLQINSVCGYGSTGRIATDIADLLLSEGEECRIAYGRENAPAEYAHLAVKIGTDRDNQLHGLQTRFLDRHGFGSKKATREFLKWVDSYDPDLIHLHNIHGYYLNIELLFDYLKKRKKPVVWTLHDCWAMTGHCAYFSAAGCDQWQTGCRRCSQLRQYPATLLWGNVANNYCRKKQAFSGLSDLTLVTPSHWLSSVVQTSFLNQYPICTIYNGIDLNTFRPTPGQFRRQHGLEDKKIILGVANVWEARKGLQDFIALSEMLDDSYRIVLVGLTQQQIQGLPAKILGITRTANAAELAQIYTEADVYVNPSVEETMGLTTAEALACGTPVITYDKTAVPEIPDETCGIVVPCGPQHIFDALGKLSATAEACQERARRFEKNQQYREYLKLYRQILSK